MGHSGKFSRADAEGPAGLGRLGRVADYCEGAGCTVNEGRVVLLYCLGWPYPKIGEAVGIRRNHVYRTLDGAARKVSREYPRFERHAPREGWFWALLWCIRNRGEGSGKVVLMERRRGIIDTYSRPALVLPEDMGAEPEEPTDVFLQVAKECDRPAAGTRTYREG